MKKFLQKKLKNEKGLTLVELLAVIVILGIIAAIAVPSIGGIIENSRVKAIKADAQTALSAANMYFAEGLDTEKDGEAAATPNKVTLAQLKTAGFLNEPGSLPTTAFIDKDKDGNKISGTGTTKGVSVIFTSATSKMITDSGKSKDVK